MPTNPYYPSPSPPPKVAEPLAPVPFERRKPKTTWTGDGGIPAPPPYDNERNRRMPEGSE